MRRALLGRRGLRGSKVRRVMPGSRSCGGQPGMQPRPTPSTMRSLSTVPPTSRLGPARGHNPTLHQPHGTYWRRLALKARLVPKVRLERMALQDLRASRGRPAHRGRKGMPGRSDPSGPKGRLERRALLGRRGLRGSKVRRVMPGSRSYGGQPGMQPRPTPSTMRSLSTVHPTSRLRPARVHNPTVHQPHGICWRRLALKARLVRRARPERMALPVRRA